MFPGAFETYINPHEWEGYSNMEEKEQFVTQENETTSHGYWHPELSSFHKLILIKCCKEEEVRH